MEHVLEIINKGGFTMYPLMLCSIVGLAKSLGLSVIAEGVETDSQFQALKNLECHFVQGYYISKAIRGNEAEKLMLENRKLG